MIALKAAIVLGLACGALSMMRRRSASLRHAVLALGFAVAALLPVLQVAAPAWGVAAIPALGDFSSVARADTTLVRSAWYAGALFGILGIAAGVARIAWIRARSWPVDARRQAIADATAAEFGVRREIVVLETDCPIAPLTWGLLRPKVLLPVAARAWSDECVRAVFRHELAHIQRGDWIVQLVAALFTRVFWFNPLAWYAARQLRLESERACDDAVLNLGVDGPDYAAQLMNVARAMAEARHRLRLAPSAVAGRGFETRIAATLNPAVNRTPLSLCGAAVMASLFVAVALAVAGFGRATDANAPSLLGVQRDVLRRFGGEERTFSIVAQDISFWKNRIQGRVELQARLNVDGSVSAVRIVEPVHPDLASAAEVIVRNWRREPARVRGVAVEVPIRMTVDFRR